MKKRVHILSAVNAANVSKSGGTYTIKDVCGAVNDIVMNGKLYTGEQLAAGASSLEGKPAPAGHPTNAKGQAISALNGEALASAWIGSYCKNVRHVGRTLTDIVVNEAQAKAHPAGAKLVERLDAAIDGTNVEPIHVSTGLYHDSITANGESGGKKYTEIVTNINYDHLAILVDGVGAGTPEQGVGLFLNEAGDADEIETVTVNAEPDDKRSTGLKAAVLRLLGLNADVSFEQIYEGLRALLPDDYCWTREVFDRYCIWSDRDGKLWRQDYAVGSDGSLSFTSQPQEVTRKVAYEPTTNSNEVDILKDKILAALNAAGIAVAGLDDAQLLNAYNALVVKPTDDKLTAANSKLAEFEANAAAATDAEVTTLATKLAVNSSLTVDDLKKLGLARLKEIETNAKGAAPVLPAPTGNKADADEFAGYSLNSHLEGK